MKTRKWFQSDAKFVALTILLLTLYAVDFINGRWAEMIVAAPLAVVVMALFDTAVIAIAIQRLHYRGWGLAAALFPLFYGLKTFLVGIEAVYLSDVLTPQMTRSLFINGLITAAVFIPTAVWTLGYWTPNESTAPTLKAARLAWRTAAAWLGKLILAGVLYLILFIAGGMLVFAPIAEALDPATAAAYAAGFEPPAWLPLFVIGRGMLWTLLALPTVLGLNGRSWTNGILLGLLFAILMADNMIIPGAIPTAIRTAHFIELFFENFFFGLTLVFLMGQPQREHTLAPSFIF